jgi:SAM-dependent methyltransferase
MGEPCKSAPELMGLINSMWTSQAVCVAAELGIADVLASGPKHIEELARGTDSHAPSLHRLMRALASLDLCQEREDGSFVLTSTGSLLCAKGPDSLQQWALWSSRYLWPLWGNLLHSVKTGCPARRLVVGTVGFEHLEHDDAAAVVFNHGMIDLTQLIAKEVARTYDFAGMQLIVDVGGGYGALLAAILAAHPDVRGVLYDLPHAIEGARAYVARANVATRCDCVAGSFFDSVPDGADAYLLKSIIHDWDDEHSAAILRNCRRAIAPGGKLVLVERILPARFEACSRHRTIARSDLTMLISCEGRERTEADLNVLLDSCGFTLTRVVLSALEFSIIEAIPQHTPCPR